MVVTHYALLFKKHSNRCAVFLWEHFPVLTGKPVRDSAPRVFIGRGSCKHPLHVLKSQVPRKTAGVQPKSSCSHKQSRHSCCQVVSDSLLPHGLQHPRLPCASPSHGVCSNSCPLNWWCYLTISSSATHFFCFQSFSTSGSFPVSQLVKSGRQNIGA